MKNNMMEGKSIKVDKYGSMIIPTPKSKRDSSNHEEEDNPSFSFAYPFDAAFPCKNKAEEPKPTYIMKDAFFAGKCEKNEDGTRTVILHGSDLHCKIGRRFQNWDTPYLTIFLSKYEHVTRLILPYNDINSAGFISLIDYILAHEQIMELDVRYNSINSPGVNYLYHKAGKMRLQILRLSGNKIGVQDAKKIAMMLTWNRSLLELEFADTDQSEASLVYFATVLRPDQQQFNDTLKTLDVSRPINQCPYMKFDSSHVATVFGLTLKYNKALEALHLRKFGFSCHDIADLLEDGSLNRSLRLLDLGCNNIGDYGAEVLSSWIKEGPALCALLLERNNITDRGVSLLSEGVRHSKIVTLDLSHNRFTDDSTLELLQCVIKRPLIRVLRIYGNAVRHHTAKAIEQMLMAEVLDQENIDVKPYEVDGKFYLAYYEGLGRK